MRAVFIARPFSPQVLAVFRESKRGQLAAVRVKILFAQFAGFMRFHARFLAVGGDFVSKRVKIVSVGIDCDFQLFRRRFVFVFVKILFTIQALIVRFYARSGASQTLRRNNLPVIMIMRFAARIATLINTRRKN